MNDLTVVIPTLNEEKNIIELIDKLYNLYPEINIIVVDDNSSDKTQELVIEKNLPTLKLIPRYKNPGLTASVLDGILASKTKFFLVMDGDLQHPPKVVKDLYEKLQDNDLVVGARIPYKENQGIHRILFTRFATKLAQLILQLRKFPVKDPMSGFFAGKTELFAKYANNKELFELAGYKVLFDFLKILKDIKIDNVYYQFEFRKGGKSKLRLAHAFYFIRSLFTKTSWRS